MAKNMHNAVTVVVGRCEQQYKRTMIMCLQCLNILRQFQA